MNLKDSNVLKNLHPNQKAILIALFLSRFQIRALKALNFGTTYKKTYDEIGRIIGVSPTRIKNYRYRFHRAPLDPNEYIEPYLYCWINDTREFDFDSFKKIITYILGEKETNEEEPQEHGFSLSDILSLNDDVNAIIGSEIIDSLNWREYENAINSIFMRIKEKWEVELDKRRDKNLRNETKELRGNENNIKSNDLFEEGWMIDGNIKTFLIVEKKYKESFRRLMQPLQENINHFDIADVSNAFREHLVRWLHQPIENAESYNTFLLTANELLSITERIVPTESEMYTTIRLVKSVRPIRETMPCMCFHFCINSICELVHLHRKPGKFRTGLMLLNKALKQLEMTGYDWIRIIRHAARMVNWKSFLSFEVIKLIYNNIFYNPTANYSLKGLEMSILLAEHTYHSNPQLNAYSKLIDYSVRLSNGFEVYGNGFTLPFGLKGYIANCRGWIVVGFRGTSDWKNFITDLVQYLVGVSAVYMMALGLLLDLKDKNNSDFLVIGHSLGGGLTQFAVAGVDSPRYLGFGYNSAGLSDIAKHLLRNKFSDNIFHLHLRNDQVFLVGNQLGSFINQKNIVYNPCTAHKIETMIHNIENQIYYNFD